MSSRAKREQHRSSEKRKEKTEKGENLHDLVLLLLLLRCCQVGFLLLWTELRERGSERKVGV